MKVASKILFQLSNSEEALKFINRTIKDNPNDFKSLKGELGPAIKPIMGYPNGYYELDLAKEFHVACFYRLCEISESAQKTRGKLSKLGLNVTGNFLLIYICNFHVLSNLLLIYICKLHWNLNTMFVCQVNPL